jgi:hypothetical protein
MHGTCIKITKTKEKMCYCFTLVRKQHTNIYKQHTNIYKNRR